jgi:two-component system, chemotaxis family, protein-glutamate methylesterase/glutaminase
LRVSEALGESRESVASSRSAPPPSFRHGLVSALGARMRQRDIVVIGGSAGAVEAGRRLVSGLPRDLAAAVFFVVHVPAGHVSQLPSILSAAGRLEAHHASDGEDVRPGRIYVAPPDHHMTLETGRVSVRRGPKENRFRPAIDPLFRSAAYVYGQRVIGVLLSGLLDDGVSGLRAIKRLGGVSVVQAPEDAMQPDMPRNALAQVDVDHVGRAADLGPLIAELAGPSETTWRSLGVRVGRGA